METLSIQTFNSMHECCPSREGARGGRGREAGSALSCGRGAVCSSDVGGRVRAARARVR